MPTELIVTPLPNGAGAAELFLSIHVAPRLTTPGAADALLQDFPLVVDWPATLSQLSLTVEVDGVRHDAAVVSTASSQLWRALFPGGTTGVFSHADPDFSASPVHSYPAAAIEGFLADQYGRYGAQGAESFPTATELLDPGSLGPLRFSGRDGAERRDQVLQAIAQERAALGHNPSTATTLDAAKEFLQVIDFHTPPTPNVLPEIPLVQLDFHRAVTLAQSYPTLLRLLGLVVDVRLPIDPTVPTGPVGVQVVVDWGALTPPTVVRPITAALHDPSVGQFQPQPSPTAPPDALRVADGFLPLEDLSRYRVVQVDTDGGAEKLVDLASGVHRAVALNRTVDTPDRYALPSLRTGGVAVARIGMAGQLHESTVRSSQIASVVAGQGAPGVFAEDVTRGVRIDVFDVAAARWYPLCSRSGTVQVASEQPIEESVEGWISVAPTGAADESVPDLYQPETLFHWDGWSLVVERPGGQIANRPDAAGNAVPGEVPESNPAVSRTPDAPHPDVDLTHRFSIPPGSLPRLRFGATYRLRARTVDLAGNGMPFGDPASTDFGHATPEFVYRRFEPVQSPPVFLRDEPLPAEEVERIVVRTDNDTGAATTTASDRHVVPPKNSQLSAEQLRLVDTGPGGAVDPAAYVMLSTRDAERLDLPASGGTPVGAFPGVFRFPQAELDVPYLPDGLARRAALTYEDGPLAGTSLLVDFTPSPGWPAVRSFRLRAVPGSGPAQLVVDDPAERIVDVPLRPADIVRVRISSAFDPGEEDLFAVWQWIVDHATQHGVPLQPLIDGAQRGRHWMLSPHRTLTFVHAVKRPLAVPTFVTWTVGRQEGNTFASLGRQITFDRPSSQRVEVVGSWQEPTDLGPGTDPPDVAAPFALQTEAVAFGHDFDHGPPDLGPVEFVGRHEFHDTKRRDITYRLRASSRFPEYFATSTQFAAPAPGQPVVIDPAGLAPGTVELQHGGSLVPPRAYSVDPPAGAITFGDGSAGAVPPPGETLDATYVPGSIVEWSAPEFRIVPSSARPAAPSIRYVVPTFGWERGTSGGMRFSTRRGGGLRIYLDRPWWSSGEGELLGVVTFPAAEPGGSNPLEVPDELAPYVTQWGNDPIYDGASLPHVHPRLADFPSATATANGLLLAERELQVNVAGHAVGFDAERDLWYSDVTVDCGDAYNPMIRLALARFQPESVPGVHLSPIVLADFAQLAPDRFTVITRGRGRRRNISVSGPSYRRTEAGKQVGRVVVQVEQRDPAWGDNQVGWRPVGDEIRLRSSTSRGTTTWTGYVIKPITDDQLRLVVTQYEKLRSDDRARNARVGVEYGYRPVYTDVIRLF